MIATGTIMTTIAAIITARATTTGVGILIIGVGARTMGKVRLERIKLMKTTRMAIITASKRTVLA
jgi:hypothetical protein